MFKSECSNDVLKDILKDTKCLMALIKLIQVFVRRVIVTSGYCPRTSLRINLCKSKIMEVFVGDEKAWRFYFQKESIWARVIKAIYGDDGHVGKVSKAGSRSCWRNIVNEVRILSNQGIKVLDYMRIKLGNGESTAFWDDNWIGGKVLKLENSLRRSIRRGVEHVQFNELSDMLQSVSLMPYSDRWVWSLEGSGEFSVASIRKIIDDNRLSTVDRTLWIKCVPIKVNVLA
nr:RNA-directed DNA polymerase, eukaryota, reverse transcriptase zinc-binding domain protein [Tanacetum cinerariifolium]